MMRTVFIVVPALLVSAVPMAFHWPTGLCIFAAVVFVGLGATRPRKDRGEF